MTDYSKLKKLATTCSIARISGWRGQMGVDESEILALIAENEAFRSVMAAIVSEIPHGEFIAAGNAPGHCHDIPGIWDQGNGGKSGKECGWCKVWNAARAMSKEPES